MEQKTVTTQETSEIPKKGVTQAVRGERGHFAEGTVPPLSPGRPAKYEKEPEPTVPTPLPPPEIAEKPVSPQNVTPQKTEGIPKKGVTPSLCAEFAARPGSA